MATYRFMLLNASGRVVDGDLQDCVDDLAALERARTLSRSHVIDIWQDARHIAKVKQGDAPLNANDTVSL
jgi:hypothetical protein